MQASGKPGATLAAEAATIAGSPEDQGALALAADNATRAFDPSRNDSSQAAAAEPSAPLGHMLHLGAAEKPAPAEPGAMLEIAAPVESPDFARALSQQVVWMADKDAQIAELRINPPELGPVEVRLHVAGDEAVVQFASAHAEVRSAIEAAIARLRESMAQAGIQLGEASVSAESFREQTAHHHGESGSQGRYRQSERAEPAWISTPIASAVRRGLVDLFA
jgi:flagellar hook-length control protein FliK